MKILQFHVVDEPDQLGGVEQIVYQLSAGLAKGPVDLAVAVNAGLLREKLEAAGVRVIRVAAKSSRDWLAWISALRRIDREFRPAWVHSHHRFTSCIAQLMPARTYQLLHTFHVEQFDKKWFRFFGDCSTAVSQGVKEHFVRDFKVDPSRITVIYNGVRPPDVTPGPLKEQLQKKDPEDRIAVLIGRLEEQKGHEYLLRALAEMPGTLRNHLKVFFVGDGSLRHPLQALKQELALDHVYFEGFQTNVGDYLKAADFTLMPSCWEGFGLGIVESYYFEKPVIASAVGGIPEVVRDGETGTLVPPRDILSLSKAICTYMENPERLPEMGQKGRALALERFTLEAMVKRYQDYYENYHSVP